MQLGAVVEMKVDDEALIERITGRYVCAELWQGLPRQVRSSRRKPASATIAARPEFIRRADDNETVRDRLAVYDDQTAPLVDYYRARGVLRTVNGNGAHIGSDPPDRQGLEWRLARNAAASAG